MIAEAGLREPAESSTVRTSVGARIAARWSIIPTARKLRFAVPTALVVVIFLFYWWSVDTSGSGIGFGGTQSDWYNQLSTGFLHGHLGLLIKPPAALVHLKDPYNPALNSQLALP